MNLDSAADDLDYMHARFYNPQTGRFLSIDPEITSAKPRAPQTWNRYVYGLNNPVKYVDPDGRAIESGWDAFNVALGATSLLANVAAGNVGGALVDLGGVTLDLAATATPGIPGGASSAIRAHRLAANAKFGKAFQSAVLNALDLAKNTERVPAVSGKAAFRVPDGLTQGILLEVKGVKDLKLTDQVRDYISAANEAGKHVVIVVRDDTRISRNFKRLEESGQVTILRATPE